MSTLVSKTQWSDMTFAIIGLGLIGGSYAKALRRLGVRRILGFNRTEAVSQKALELGLIDQKLDDNDPALGEADVIIMAIYPEAILDYLQRHRNYLKSGAIVTDAAGIKNDLCREAQEILGERGEFIGGHPMAGRQGKGLDLAAAELFDGANYIVVPESHNRPETIQWLSVFAKAIGFAHTVCANPEEHDHIIAYTSDLPHITAVALVNSDTFGDKTKYFTAGSFRDGTRVAEINPELWSELFLANEEKISAQLDRYIEELNTWRRALKAHDTVTLKKMMLASTERKQALKHWE